MSAKSPTDQGDVSFWSQNSSSRFSYTRNDNFNITEPITSLLKKAKQKWIETEEKDNKLIKRTASGYPFGLHQQNWMNEHQNATYLARYMLRWSFFLFLFCVGACLCLDILGFKQSADKNVIDSWLGFHIFGLNRYSDKIASTRTCIVPTRKSGSQYSANDSPDGSKNIALLLGIELGNKGPGWQRKESFRIRVRIT